MPNILTPSNMEKGATTAATHVGNFHGNEIAAFMGKALVIFVFYIINALFVEPNFKCPCLLDAPEEEFHEKCVSREWYAITTILGTTGLAGFLGTAAIIGLRRKVSGGKKEKSPKADDDVQEGNSENEGTGSNENRLQDWDELFGRNTETTPKAKRRVAVFVNDKDCDLHQAEREAQYLSTLIYGKRDQIKLVHNARQSQHAEEPIDKNAEMSEKISKYMKKDVSLVIFAYGDGTRVVRVLMTGSNSDTPVGNSDNQSESESDKIAKENVAVITFGGNSLFPKNRAKLVLNFRLPCEIIEIVNSSDITSMKNCWYRCPNEPSKEIPVHKNNSTAGDAVQSGKQKSSPNYEPLDEQQNEQTNEQRSFWNKEEISHETQNVIKQHVGGVRCTTIEEYKKIPVSKLSNSSLNIKVVLQHIRKEPQIDTRQPILTIQRLCDCKEFSTGFGYFLFSVTVWLTILLIDGDYFACANTCIAYQNMTCTEIELLNEIERPYTDEYARKRNACHIIGYSMICVLVCILTIAIICACKPRMCCFGGLKHCHCHEGCSPCCSCKSESLCNCNLYCCSFIKSSDSCDCNLCYCCPCVESTDSCCPWCNCYCISCPSAKDQKTENHKMVLEAKELLQQAEPEARIIKEI